MAVDSTSYSRTAGTKSHTVRHPEGEVRHCISNLVADRFSSRVACGVTKVQTDSPDPPGRSKYCLHEELIDRRPRFLTFLRKCYDVLRDNLRESPDSTQPLVGAFNAPFAPVAVVFRICSHRDSAVCCASSAGVFPRNTLKFLGSRDSCGPSEWIVPLTLCWHKNCWSRVVQV
jgi:hypothetical protein